MDARGGSNFMVQLNKKEVVTPLSPVKEHRLPLSNLDLLMPPSRVHVFFCYKKPPAFTYESMVDILKRSLAEVLVSFYVFSGDMVENPLGELELVCHNRGVDFVEAFADIDLQNLDLGNTHQSILGKLVPKLEQGVFCAQVTEFKCGGIMVSCTFNHRVADAYSCNVFLLSWGEIARSKNPSIKPCFDRSLLRPRQPLVDDNSMHKWLVPLSSLPPPPPQNTSSSSATVDDVIGRFYYVESSQLNTLHTTAAPITASSKRKNTKLEVFSAFVWKMIASKEVEGKKRCNITMPVDGRSRLDKSLVTYFGNVLSSPIGTKTVGELQEMSLSQVADAVQEFLKPGKTREHFLNLIDWIESHKPDVFVGDISIEKDGPIIAVTSGLQFPMSDIEFGWGKPLLGTYCYHPGNELAFVHPIMSPVGNGDWVVYMNMSKTTLELFETKAGHVFKPLTMAYLQNHEEKRKIPMLRSAL